MLVYQRVTTGFVGPVLPSCLNLVMLLQTKRGFFMWHPYGIMVLQLEPNGGSKAQLQPNHPANYRSCNLCKRVMGHQHMNISKNRNGASPQWIWGYAALNSQESTGMIPRKPVMDVVSFTHMYHVQNIVCGLWMFAVIYPIPWEAKQI